MRKQSLLVAVCLLTIVASAPALAAASAPAWVGQSVCPSAAVPAPLFKTELFCVEGVPCLSNDDCWAACSTAVTATCVGDSCHYTYTSGGGGTGGGTGGGGDSCPEIPCDNNSQCLCGSRQGVCLGDSCRY